MVTTCHCICSIQIAFTIIYHAMYYFSESMRIDLPTLSLYVFHCSKNVVEIHRDKEAYSLNSFEAFDSPLTNSVVSLLFARAMEQDVAVNTVK